MPEFLIAVAVVMAHAIAIALLVANQRRNPTATLAWLTVLIFVPILGLGAYLLFGQTRYRKTVKRSAKAAARIDAVRTTWEAEARRSLRLDGGMEHRTVSLLKLGTAVCSSPPTLGNRARILIDGRDTYQAMIDAVESARRHVHVLFYIIQPDETGRRLLEALSAKARQGLEVRVLVDAIGSSRLDDSFWEPLRQAGGKAAFFGPVRLTFARLRRRDRIDFRNHRKIVVVDGELGFTGGINIGREYLGLDPEIGPWRDTHVELEGPAVLGLQATFASDWLATTGELLDDDRYFPPAQPHPQDAIVQIVDSGPDSRWAPIEAMYDLAMSSARERLWITNAYFVPSPAIESALTSAALRGVDVRLLIPERSDSRIVQLAVESYLPTLLAAGVSIHKYQRGFIHAKTMLVDDWVATIGSANMDMRSFNLNFEINPFVFDPTFVEQLATTYLHDLGRSRQITTADIAHHSIPRRLAIGFARLLSPLL